MTDKAERTVPEMGRFGRAIATAGAFLQSMNYTSFDYTLDRIQRLEQDVAQLQEEIRQVRDLGAVGSHNTGAAALEH